MSSDKPLRVITPLEKGELLVQRVVVTEELGRLSHILVDLLSLNPEIKLPDVLGKSMTVEVDLADGKVRHFNGLVSRLSQLGREGRFVQYQAEVRPWLWFLTRTADCRIYPDQKETRSATVPEIVKTIFRLHGFSDFKDELKGTYKPREYCVQYRESDFQFVSRLMEEEGIYYFVEHEEKKHFIVLADDPDSHKPTPNCKEVPFFSSAEKSASRADHFDTWLLTQEVQTGAYVLNDYDFEVPRADQIVKATERRSHAHAEFPVFDSGFFVHAYKASGEKGDPDAADRAQGWVRTRLQECQVEHEKVEGAGNVRALATGGLTKLTEYHRVDQNRDYLIVSTSHEFQVGGFEGIAFDDSTPFCRCTCVAIPKKVPFRPRRITPRPNVAGHQTATVVGKEGEDIWTDMHGRVKVQFHWDRYGARDENSSCWVRVSQIWAGKNWGSMHIPRMGQEVVVAFEEGDIDRPLVIGRLYNGPNKPPYELPANQSQSGIKSRSTKGGAPANFNEIRFEDKKGSEDLYIHAEKNETIVVENDKAQSVGHDETLDVGNNRTKTVGVDQSEKIGSNKTIDVGSNHTEKIGADKKLTVGSNHTEDIGSSMTITVGSMLTETVAINYAETVGVAMELTVGATLTETVGGSHGHTVGGGLTQTIGKDKGVTVGGGETVKIGKDKSETVGGNKTVSVTGNLDQTISGQKGDKITKEYALTAKKISIAAEEEIVIVTGSAKIILKKNGDIAINGKDISFTGSGKITGKADTDMVLKGGSKITLN